MTADALIDALRAWLATQPAMPGESHLQAAVEAKLREMGVGIEPQHVIANARAGGVSKLDVLVTTTEPRLAIELKADGDWTGAAQAAWQLFQARELLGNGGVQPRALALLGGPISDPLLPEMFMRLGIEVAAAGMASRG